MFQTVKKVGLNPYFINFKRPSPHSKFSPSSADRWLATGCPFSTEFILKMNIPEERSEYADEGTFAHSMCEAVFREKYYGLAIPSKLINDIQMWAMQDVDKRGNCIEEMMRCAHEYLAVIDYWMQNKEQIGEIVFYGQEVGVPIFPDENCFGTADFLIIGTKGAVLIDFKYGKGKNVKADTVQLKVYGAGVARFLENYPPDYRMHVVIHQPRTDANAKETSYLMVELYDFLHDIWNAIQLSKQKELSPVEGNHCYWCPAKRTKDPAKKCPSILDKPLRVAQENFASFLNDMTPPADAPMLAFNPKRDAAILKLHTLYPMIKALVEDTTEEIKFRMQKGELVPGFQIKDELGNREIAGEDDVSKAKLIASKFPSVNPWKEVPATNKLRTLSDIEKEIGKNKLDVICVKKIKKKLDVMSDAQQNVLKDLMSYAQMIDNNGQEE